MILIFTAYFLLIASIGFPPMLLVTIPLTVIVTRRMTRRVREQRQAVREAQRQIAHRAYMADLRRRAGGEA